MRDDLIEKHKTALTRVKTHWDIAAAQWGDRPRYKFEEEFWSELLRNHMQTHKDITALLETLTIARRFLKSQNTES